jgi:DivIVA domain-containing protein
MMSFLKVLRGYRIEDVDLKLAYAAKAAESGTAEDRARAAAALRNAQFARALRGYDRNQVDAAVARLLERLDGVAPPHFEVDFSVVLRGYDVAAVDALLAQAQRAMASDDATERAAAAAAVSDAQLPSTLRGYDRNQVDDFLARLERELV